MPMNAEFSGPASCKRKSLLRLVEKEGKEFALRGSSVSFRQCPSGALRIPDPPSVVGIISGTFGGQIKRDLYSISAAASFSRNIR